MLRLYDLNSLFRPPRLRFDGRGRARGGRRSAARLWRLDARLGANLDGLGDLPAAEIGGEDPLSSWQGVCFWLALRRISCGCRPEIVCLQKLVNGVERI